MTLFNGLEHLVTYDEPMAARTWMRLGGPARYFVRPQSLEDRTEVVHRCRDNDVRMYVLGEGANLLVNDAGVRGAVIHLGRGACTGEGTVGGKPMLSDAQALAASTGIPAVVWAVVWGAFSLWLLYRVTIWSLERNRMDCESVVE